MPDFLYQSGAHTGALIWPGRRASRDRRPRDIPSGREAVPDPPTCNLKIIHQTTGATQWNRLVNSAITDAAGDVWDWRQVQLPGVWGVGGDPGRGQAPVYWALPRLGDAGPSDFEEWPALYETRIRKYARATGALIAEYVSGFSHLPFVEYGTLNPAVDSSVTFGCYGGHRSVNDKGQRVTNAGLALTDTSFFSGSSPDARLDVFVQNPQDHTAIVKSYCFRPTARSGITHVSLRSATYPAALPSPSTGSVIFLTTDSLSDIQSEIQSQLPSVVVSATVTSSSGPSGTMENSFVRIDIEWDSPDRYFDAVRVTRAATANVVSPVVYDMVGGKILTYGVPGGGDPYVVGAPLDSQWCTDGEACGTQLTDVAGSREPRFHNVSKWDASASPWTLTWDHAVWPGNPPYNYVVMNYPASNNPPPFRIRSLYSLGGYVRAVTDAVVVAGGGPSFYGYWCRDWTDAAPTSGSEYRERLVEARMLSHSDTTPGFGVVGSDFEDRMATGLNPGRGLPDSQKSWDYPYLMNSLPQWGQQNVVSTSKQSAFWFGETAPIHVPIRGFAMGCVKAGSFMGDANFSCLSPLTYYNHDPSGEDVRVYGTCDPGASSVAANEVLTYAWSDYARPSPWRSPAAVRIDTYNSIRHCDVLFDPDYTGPWHYYVTYVKFFQQPGLLFQDCEWRLRFTGGPANATVETDWMPYSTTLAEFQTELDRVFADGTFTTCSTWPAPTSFYTSAVQAELNQLFFSETTPNNPLPEGGTGMLWQEGLTLRMFFPWALGTFSDSFHNTLYPDSWGAIPGSAPLRAYEPFIYLDLRNPTTYSVSRQISCMEMDNSIVFQRDFGQPASARVLEMQHHDSRLYVLGETVSEEMTAPAP